MEIVVQIYRSSLLAAVHTLQVSVEPRLSTGIERSLSHAVVIKTKSLPISATTFATVLSLYIAQDGKKRKHNPTLSANNSWLLILILVLARVSTVRSLTSQRRLHATVCRMMTGDRRVALAQLGYFSPLVVDHVVSSWVPAPWWYCYWLSPYVFALQFCHLDAVDCEAKSLIRFYPFPKN